MFCTKCGSVLEDGAKFCTNCGAQTPYAQAPAPAESTPLSEYLSDPDPAKRDRAHNWRMAIGLQKVDGLSVSSFLLDLARKNIESRMTNEEVRLAIDAHYAKQPNRA